jgi:hypothetical protein
VLFALALAWALLWLGFWVFGEQLEALNPLAEGYRLHALSEEYLPPLVFVLLAGVVTAIVVRFWPGFLRLPLSVTPLRVLLTLLLAVPIVALALVVALIAVSLAIEPPPWESDNLQYVPLVFWVAPLGTMALTPIISLVVAWWWIIQHSDANQQK